MKKDELFSGTAGVAWGPDVAEHADLLDELASSLRRDAGAPGAEAELADRYRADDRIHPGA